MSAVATIETDEALGDSLADANEIWLELERTHLSGNFFAFVEAAWHVIEPGTKFVPNWHLVELCKTLQLIALDHDYKERKRWLVNIPPGTLKSIVLVMFNAWVWTWKPAGRFVTAAYGAHLTTRDNLRVRDIILSKWYQDRWPLRLIDDQNTKTRYNTERGGWRIATSVCGVGQGEHPDFFVIDDPITAVQAESLKERTAANDWFDNTVSTRGITRKCVIIVIMQRLHKNDLAGHLLKRGGWDIVRFPMRYEKCTCPSDVPVTDENRCVLHKADPDWAPDPRDHRTEAGELLHPILIPEKAVRTLELDLGPYGAAGQLQQRPAPAAGGLFKREHFKYREVAPVIARRARGWDTAATAGGGDYTAGVRIAEADDLYFIEHVVRGQWGPSDVDKTIHATAEADGPECSQREEREGGAAGKTVIEARLKTLAGFDYEGVSTSGSKITRAKPFRAQVEGGNVFIIRTGDPVKDAWIEPYLQELCDFPTGDHDDQVDGSSAAFNAVLLEYRPTVQRAVW